VTPEWWRDLLAFVGLVSLGVWWWRVTRVPRCPVGSKTHHWHELTETYTPEECTFGKKYQRTVRRCCKCRQTIVLEELGEVSEWQVEIDKSMVRLKEALQREAEVLAAESAEVKGG